MRNMLLATTLELLALFQKMISDTDALAVFNFSCATRAAHAILSGYLSM